MSQAVSQKILEIIEAEVSASQFLGAAIDLDYVADQAKHQCGRYPSEDEWMLSCYPTCQPDDLAA